MCFYGGTVNEVYREKIDKYGTDDFDIIEKMEKYANQQVETRANELADKKAEEIFNKKKEQFQLEVLKQIQADSIRKEGTELASNSQLKSKTFVLDGLELHTSDYIPDSVPNDSPFEKKLLNQNHYSLEWEEKNNRTGKKKFVAKWNPIIVLVANPSSVGKCEEIIVQLQGQSTPLVFPNGNISLEEFRRQTRFARKGLNVSVSSQYESFLRAIRECPTKRFLTIPKHTGGVMLQDGKVAYIDSNSVISGLEDLFPVEIKEHVMVMHTLPLEEITAIYHKALPKSVGAKLASVIRDESILLPLFGAEGLHSDRGYVFTYSNYSVREVTIALTKRKNYTSMVVQALTDRITKIKKELASANDVTVPFTFSGIFEEGYALDNALRQHRTIAKEGKM